MIMQVINHEVVKTKPLRVVSMNGLTYTCYLMRIRPDLASKVIIHFPFIPDTPRYVWQEPVA
jgi:hypothetical protein